MQRLLAITWLTIKAAFRFRLVLMLAVVLLGGVILLPLVIKDLLPVLGINLALCDQPFLFILQIGDLLFLSIDLFDVLIARLPLGIQLVGPRDGDARLLRTARWLAARIATG